MIPSEHDRLLSGYLTGEIESTAFDEVDQLLREDAEAAARLLELAKVELLLQDGGTRLAELTRQPIQSGPRSHASWSTSNASRFNPPSSRKVIQFPARNFTRTSVSSRGTSPSRTRLQTFVRLAVVCLAALIAIYIGLPRQHPILRMETVVGDVRFTHGRASGKVKTGDGFASGTRIEVLPDSKCMVRFEGEETHLQLFARTDVEFEVNARGGKRLNLRKGLIDAQVAPQKGQSMQIKTAHAVATVIGTGFAIAEDAKRSAIQVTSGEVGFADARDATAIQVGHGRLALVGSDFPLQLVPPDAVRSVTDLLASRDALHGRRMIHDWAFEGDTEDHAGGLQTAEFGVRYAAGQRGRALDLSKGGGFTTELSALPEKFELEFYVWVPKVEPVMENGVSKRTVICNSASGYTDDGFRLMVFASLTNEGSLLLEAGDGYAGSAARSEPGSVPPDKWNHVIMRLDRITGRVRFTVNGQDRTATGEGLNRDFRSLARLTVGMMENGKYQLNGMVDELRMFSVSSDTP